MSFSKSLADFLSANRPLTFFVSAEDIREMVERSRGYYQIEEVDESAFFLVRRTPKRGDNIIEIRTGLIVHFVCQLVEEEALYSTQWEPTQRCAWVPRILKGESRFSFDLNQEKRLLEDLRVSQVRGSFPERVVKGPSVKLTQLHQGVRAELRLFAATYCFESEYSLLRRTLEEKLDCQDLASGDVSIWWSPDPLPEDYLLKMILKVVEQEE